MSLFDYAFIVFTGLDKSRTSDPQTAHNSQIRFSFGNIPFIPTTYVNNHLTHKRLQLGWLSLTNSRHFQMGCLIYNTISNKNPKYFDERLKLRNFFGFTSIRLSPRIFNYAYPRTIAWQSSFLILGCSLLNRLVVTSFSQDRITEFKNLRI